MGDSLYPAVWFDNNAAEAFELYCKLFPNSKIRESNTLVVSANLYGTPLIGINGGPIFKPNNSISFMVICEDKSEISQYWRILESGGTILMPIQEYPWSPYYGWLNDKYGVGWQLYLGKRSDVNNQSIVPTLMFCGKQQGRCNAALQFYESLFPSFKQQGILQYEDGDVKGQVMHSQFTANGFTMMAMDSGVPQDFTFNEGISIVIPCTDQKEIDYYWDAITKDGDESQCGWCKDQFGVSWQTVPKNLDEILQNQPEAWKNLMKMKKIIINRLID